MNIFFWIFIFIIFFILHLPGFSFPFIRDQGAYAYIAWRLAEGDFGGLPLDNKPPGIYVIYALIFKLLGPNDFVIKILGFLFAFLGTLLFYKIISLFCSKKNTFLSTILYTLLINSLWLEVSFANTEIFLIPFLLASFYYFSLFILKKKKVLSILLSGIFLGLSLLIKQTIVPTIAFFLLYLVSEFRKKHFKTKTIIYFLTGLSLPLTIVFGFLFLINTDLFNGILRNFVLVNFEYLQGGFFSSEKKPILSIFWWFLTVPKTLFWIYLFCLGGMILILKRGKMNERLNIALLFSLSLFLSAKIGGLRNFPHYYIPLVFGLCILFGALLEQIKGRRQFSLRMLFFLFLVLVYLFQHFDFYLYHPNEAFRKLYPAEADFFSQAKIVGELVRKETNPDDRIFVWGNEPEIYFYAKRKSSSKHINLYFLKGMEERLDLIEELKSYQPQIIVISRGVKKDEFVGLDFVKEDKSMEFLYNHDKKYKKIFDSPVYVVYKLI